MNPPGDDRGRPLQITVTPADRAADRARRSARLRRTITALGTPRQGAAALLAVVLLAAVAGPTTSRLAAHINRDGPRRLNTDAPYTLGSGRSIANHTTAVRDASTAPTGGNSASAGGQSLNAAGQAPPVAAPPAQAEAAAAPGAPSVVVDVERRDDLDAPIPGAPGGGPSTPTTTAPPAPPTTTAPPTTAPPVTNPPDDVTAVTIPTTTAPPRVISGPITGPLPGAPG